MTKRLADLTPEQAEKQREYVSSRHKFRYANDAAYKARKDRQANECRMRKRYGIGSVERDAMLLEQGGVCAICSADSPGNGAWHIDHCHRTGKVRAILCPGCNTFVGRIESDPERHQAALAYIARHSRHG